MHKGDFNNCKIIVAKEYYANEETGTKINYLRIPNVDNQSRFTTVKTTSTRWRTLVEFFKDVFLPHGFPDSVSSDYVEYQIWDSIQAFASSTIGAVAMQAVLKGMGVGDETATPMAATLTWLLKDGTSKVCRIMFAWFQGTSLDHDCKKWRLFADIVNDIAFCFDLAMPFCKECVTTIACLTSVLRCMVDVAGGGTRAALTQHQSRWNNAADVSAKDGSQEQLLNLVGCVFALFLIPIISGNQILIWVSFVLFTALHLYANYKAVRCLRFNTLNTARYRLVVERFIKARGIVMTVDEANMLEPVFFGWSLSLLDIDLGVSLGKAFPSYQSLLNALKVHPNDTPYLLNMDFTKGKVYAVLRGNCDVVGVLRAYFEAELIRICYLSAETLGPNSTVAALQKAITRLRYGSDTYNDVIECVRRVSDCHFDGFVSGMRAKGWDIDRTNLNCQHWRAEWAGSASKLD